MRCSSCIGGNRGSQSSSDYESTSTAVKANRTADLKHGRQRMDPQSHDVHQQRQHSTRSLDYRVDSPSSQQECNGNVTVFGSSDNRPPSITIEELDDDDDETDNAGERNQSGQYENVHDPASDNFNRFLTHSSRLEVIREEECSDCSDGGEYSHILPANDSTVQPSSVHDLVDGAPAPASGDERTGVAHVTTKFNPASVLRAFIKHRRQRRKGRRQGDSPHQGATTRFRQKEHQVPTTCVLVDTRESDMAPAEYRSICTTETVSVEMMQAEVINIGSNSSSLDDLSDIDTETSESMETQQQANTTPGCDVFIDQMEDDGVQAAAAAAAGPPSSESNDGTTTLAISSTANQCLQCDVVLNHSEGSSATHALLNHFQPNQMLGGCADDDIANDSTLSGGDVCDEHGDDAERINSNSSSSSNIYNAEKMSEMHKITLESGGGPDSTVPAKIWPSPEVSSFSVVVDDRDRASAVVGSDQHAITALKDPPCSVIDRDRASTCGIDSTVNHCVRDEETLPPPVEKNMHPSEGNSAAASCEKVENQTITPTSPPPIPAPRVAVKAPIPLPASPLYENANVTNLGQHPADSAENCSKSTTPLSPPPPPPLPLAQLVPLTVEALSSSTSGSASSSSPVGKDAQAHSGDHTGKSDHADANQISTEDCVNAVASPERQELLSNSAGNDQSVLFKLIQEQSGTVSTTSSESHYAQGKVEKLGKGSTSAIQAQGNCMVADTTRSQADDGSNSDREPKIEQSDEDHGGQNNTCASYDEATIVRLPSNSHNARYETVTTETTAGSNSVSIRQPNAQAKLPSKSAETFDTAKESSNVSHRAEKTASEMRTEISFLKDAELQEEFRKLELETARYERELQQIRVPSRESGAGRNQADPGRKYFVSKQKDFAIERSSVANVNNTVMSNSTVAVGSNDRAKGESLKMNVPRERRELPRSYTNHQAEGNASLASGHGPIPPPPPPPAVSTEPSNGDEETFTKKVKDRVRELMASQAAAEEANQVIKLRGGGVVASAPSTPTASRKHIEAEFKEFREIRQREAIADGKLSDHSNMPAKQQQPPHTGESAERQDKTDSSSGSWLSVLVPIGVGSIVWSVIRFMLPYFRK